MRRSLTSAAARQGLMAAAGCHRETFPAAALAGATWQLQLSTCSHHQQKAGSDSGGWLGAAAAGLLGAVALGALGPTPWGTGLLGATAAARADAGPPPPGAFPSQGQGQGQGVGVGQGQAPDGPQAQTNHPLEYDPVTNEHTARMTMARSAALDYYNAKKYAQAEAKFREALAEAQLGFEPHDPHIASAKNNLAEFYRNTGQWGKAEELYKEALDLLERNYGEKHWLFVSALHNLALCLEAAGRVGEARAAMERVLGLRLAMFGPRHFLYADSLYALGHMVRKEAIRQRGREGEQREGAGKGRGARGGRGRGGKAEDGAAEGLRMMAEAVRVLEEAENVQTSVVLFWLTEVAAAYAADGDPAAAAEALRRAVAHMARDRGDAAASASAVNEQLTEALARAGRAAEAVAAAEAALAARRELFGSGTLVVAQSELKVAQLQLQAAGPSSPTSAPHDAAASSSAAVSALGHAEEAARVAAAVAEECGRGSIVKGPPPDRLVKRLRAACVLGGAARLVAGLAGVGEHPAAAAAAGQAGAGPGAQQGAGQGSGTSGGGTGSRRGWSWWPFGRRTAKPPPQADQGAPAASSAPAAPDTPPSPASAPSPAPSLPPRGVLLSSSDVLLGRAIAALEGATQAGQELLQSVSSGRPLPPGVDPEELAGCLVEAQLALLDTLERAGGVLAALGRLAAEAAEAAEAAGAQGQGGQGGQGQGAASPAVDSGRLMSRMAELQDKAERVAAALMG